tara:strand:- start:724 stop:1302 length:579 start_codon:yes stop_codon:yes gene_type:complete
MKKLLLFIFVFLNTNNIFADDSFLPIIEGNKNAKVKLIIYESLTCSHCANFHKDIYPELKKEFIDKGKVNIEFRNFPLDLAALNAAKIAHCKNDGDSDILHFLYFNQKTWTKGSNILEINKNLEKLIISSEFNLNFENCINNKKMEDYILEERIAGFKQYEIEATPTLIINDKKFDKTLNYKNLKKILKKML